MGGIHLSPNQLMGRPTVLVIDGRATLDSWLYSRTWWLHSLLVIFLFDGLNEFLNESQVGIVTMSALLLWQSAASCLSTRSVDPHGALGILVLWRGSMVMGIDWVSGWGCLIGLGTWGVHDLPMRMHLLHGELFGRKKHLFSTFLQCVHAMVWGMCRARRKEKLMVGKSVYSYSYILCRKQNNHFQVVCQWWQLHQQGGQRQTRWIVRQGGQLRWCRRRIVTRHQKPL